LSEKLKSKTFSGRMKEAHNGIAEFEGYLADLENSPEAVWDPGFV